MTRIFTFLVGLAIIATTATAYGNQITWDAGAPGGSSGTSVNFEPGAVGSNTAWFDTGVAASGLSNYTIGMWVKQDVTPTGGVTAPSGNVHRDQWFLGHENRGLHLGFYSNPDTGDQPLRHAHWGSDSNGPTTITAGTWVHATFTYDGTTGNTYINGALENSVAKNAPNNTSGNIILGTRDTQGSNGGTGRNPFEGNLDDIAFFDSVLSATDIADLASGAQGAVALGAGAYWDFEDDVTGTTAAVQGTGLGGNALTGIVPEPSSFALLFGMGAFGFLAFRKR